MDKQMGYHAINMCKFPLVVRSGNGEELLGTIYPKEKYVILDSWVDSNNKYINSKVKFVNDDGEFICGYLYDIVYTNQVSIWSQWSFGSFYVPSAGSCNIFHIKDNTNVYDENGIFIREIKPGEMVASFNCESHPIYENYMAIDYIRCLDIKDDGWKKFSGFIDTKINVDSFDTPILGVF